MAKNCTKLSLEETCAKLCRELDKDTDEELQGFIDHAKASLECIHDEQISQGAIKELVRTLLVISLVQEKEICELKDALKKRLLPTPPSGCRMRRK